MANTEIDSLSLDIKITGLRKEDVANIDKLSRAIKRLSDSLATADFSKLRDIKVPKGIKSIQLITQNFNEKTKELANSVTGSITQQEMEQTGKSAKEVAKDVEDSSLKVQNASSKYKIGFSTIINWLRNFRKERNKEKGKDKTIGILERFRNIFKRIKTITFIKAIRGLLNAIVKAVKTGVQNLALFDKSFNETISRIKSNLTQASSGFALIVRPIIETLEPFIISASQTLATIGNEISRIQASIKGMTTYTKVNAKYMEDYARSVQKASLFSFDTFETLDIQDNSKFETASVDEQEESNEQIKAQASLLKNVQKLLSNILDIFKTISGEALALFEYISPALNEVLTLVNNILDPILPFVKNLLTSLNPLVQLILSGILAPLLKILNVILTPILEVIRVILPIVNDIVSMVVDILSPILETFEPLLTTVKDELEPIANIITFMVDIIGGLIDTLKNILGNVLSMIKNDLGLIFGLLSDSFAIVSDLFNWDFEKFRQDFIKFFKDLARGLLMLLASIVDGVVNSIIDAINVIFIPLNKLSEWFSWGWELGIPHINLASLVPEFANGGIVGELWQMNEYGNPEMLYSANNSGNTSVINQAQLSLAFEQAIYNTGLLDAIAKAGIINIDGKAVAQSSTFKSELNRTNPSLNLR